jgi:hypothetical protein
VPTASAGTVRFAFLPFIATSPDKNPPARFYRNGQVIERTTGIGSFAQVCAEVRTLAPAQLATDARPNVSSSGRKSCPRLRRIRDNAAERNRRLPMLPFYLVLGSVLVLSVLSGGAAIALAFSRGRLDACRRRTVDRLSQIAFIGAAGIVALLYAFFPG